MDLDLAAPSDPSPTRDTRGGAAGWQCLIGIVLGVLAFLLTETPALSFMLFLASLTALGTAITRSCPISGFVRTLLRRSR